MSKRTPPPIFTAYVGTNRHLLPKILSLYVPPGSVIADVTYGKGAFWKDVDLSLYRFLPSDLQDGIDFRQLPYREGEIDCLVIDPPYMHGGIGIKPSINDCYRNRNSSHESVIRLYAGGFLEAARVLKKGGIMLVKCQDETESGKQHLSHCEIAHLLEVLGFAILDLFVLVQQTVPAMRYPYQRSARKNHSYAIIAKFRR